MNLLPVDQRLIVVHEAFGLDGGAVSAESEALVPAHGQGDLAPVEAVALARCARGALGGVSVFLSSAHGDTATPPAVVWELRARYGARAEIIATGPLAKWIAWDMWGGIVHVTGRACEGWELWVQAPTRCFVRLRWVVLPARGAGSFHVENGSLV